MPLSYARFFKDFQYKAFRDFLCFQTDMQSNPHNQGSQILFNDCGYFFHKPTKKVFIINKNKTSFMLNMKCTLSILEGRTNVFHFYMSKSLILLLMFCGYYGKVRGWGVKANKHFACLFSNCCLRKKSLILL